MVTPEIHLSNVKPVTVLIVAASLLMSRRTANVSLLPVLIKETVQMVRTALPLPEESAIAHVHRDLMLTLMEPVQTSMNVIRQFDPVDLELSARIR